MMQPAQLAGLGAIELERDMSFFGFFGSLFGGKKKSATPESAAPELSESPTAASKPQVKPVPPIKPTLTAAPEPTRPSPPSEPVPDPAPNPPVVDAPTMAAQAVRMLAGAAAPLSQSGFDAVRATLSIATEALWAVMNVESRGSGFLPSGRPKILFEGHWFSRLTGGVHDAAHGDISYPNWSHDHYLGGEREYERLERAVALDREIGRASCRERV